jgi:hypothetical protein
MTDKDMITGAYNITLDASSVAVNLKLGFGVLPSMLGWDL